MDPSQQLGAQPLHGAAAPGGAAASQPLASSLSAAGESAGSDGSLQNQSTNSTSSVDGDADVGTDAEGLSLSPALHHYIMMYIVCTSSPCFNT